MFDKIEIKCVNQNAVALQVAAEVLKEVYGKYRLKHFKIKGRKNDALRIVEVAIRRAARLETCEIRVELELNEHTGDFELAWHFPDRFQFRRPILFEAAAYGIKLRFCDDRGEGAQVFGEDESKLEAFKALLAKQTELDRMRA